MPTNPDVLIKRGIEEEYWAEALGYRLTKEEWRRHHKTVAETRPPRIESESDMLYHGETRLEPLKASEHNEGRTFEEPKRVTKMKAIYLPKSYSSSAMQTGQEYDIEVEQLATGRPIKMLKPIEAVYPSLQSFSKTWKVVG